MNLFEKVIPEMDKDKDGNEVKNKVFGKISLRRPTYLERADYMEACGYDVKDDGVVKSDRSKIGAMKVMVKCSLPHYDKVELKKDDGTEIKSLDDMLLDPDCDPILAEIAGMLLNGFRVSKN